MGYLIDKNALKAKLERIKEVYELMPEKARACDVCYTLFTKDKRGFYDRCWCDYESPEINYQD